MNEQMASALTQLFDRLNIASEFKSQVAVLTSQVTTLSDNFKGLNIVVNGNGKKGHNDRIRDLEEDVKDLKQWHADWKKEREDERKEMRGIRNSIIVAVIMLVVTTVVNIFVR
jgi:hypothetical protein